MVHRTHRRNLPGGFLKSEGSLVHETPAAEPFHPFRTEFMNIGNFIGKQKSI
jgi:hypothetical protein